MSPLITFYILAGIVGLAVLVFIVMIVVTALRPPQLPELSINPPPLQRIVRALTPVPAARPTPPPVAVPPPVPISVPVPAPVRRPIYRRRRSRLLTRIVIGTIVTLTLASGTIIAFPSLLDPLCDDYEWFGTEAASVVRHHACDAHNAIYELVEGL